MWVGTLFSIVLAVAFSLGISQSSAQQYPEFDGVYVRDKNDNFIELPRLPEQTGVEVRFSTGRSMHPFFQPVYDRTTFSGLPEIDLSTVQSIVLVGIAPKNFSYRSLIDLKFHAQIALLLSETSEVEYTSSGRTTLQDFSSLPTILTRGTCGYPVEHFRVKRVSQFVTEFFPRQDGSVFPTGMYAPSDGMACVSVNKNAPAIELYFGSKASFVIVNANGEFASGAASTSPRTVTLDDLLAEPSEMEALPFGHGDYAADPRMCPGAATDDVNSAVADFGDKAWDKRLTIQEGSLIFREFPCTISSSRRTSAYSFSVSAQCWIPDRNQEETLTFNFTKINGNTFALGGNNFRPCKGLSMSDEDEAADTSSSAGKLIGIYGYDRASLDSDCEIGPLEVRSESIQFYDFSCSFETSMSPDSTVHISEASCNGEGETWDETLSLRSIGDDTLEVHTRNTGNTVEYFRCKSAP